MATADSVKAKIQKLIDSANTVTGKTDTNLTDAQASLIDGYGSEPVLQDKTITANGTYTADSGYDGLGSVTVEVESSSSGSSIVANAIGATIALELSEPSINYTFALT